MSRKVVHVVSDKEGGWNVKSEKTSRAAANFENKSDAIDKAKEIAKNAPLGQVKIHGLDSKIQTEYTYGKDPRKYKG